MKHVLKLLVCLTAIIVTPSFAANLPTGYTELEYIESSGTQYINTGLTVKSNTLADFDYQYTDCTNKNYVFGQVAGNSTSIMGYRTDRIWWFAKKDLSNGCDLNKHTISFASDGKVYKDGNILATRGTFGSIQDNLFIKLFAEQNDGGQINIGRVKIYHFAFKEGSTMVRDFVPAKNASGVIGMYDTVNNVFYTNAGTGTFTAGPTACPGGTLETRHESGLPVGYTKVEYLQSDGSAYINTGILTTAHTDMEIVAKTTSSGTRWLIGNHQGVNNSFVIAQRSADGNIIADIGNSGSNRVASNIAGQSAFHKMAITSKSFYIDDELIGAKVDANISTDLVLYVFASGAGGASISQIKSARIWNNSQLVFDGIPAKNSQNVLGMYDLVSGQFFTNASTGSFTAGDEVSDPIVEQCVAGTGIKIATTKYTEDAFAGLMTTLSEAITKVTNIVDTTVQQATEIGNLATTKQDRPDTDCPAGRKCLLIMGADNKPHWYLIQE